jgi:hypothetical protein
MNKRFLFLVVACTTAFLVLAQQNKKTDIQKMQDEFEKYKNEERESFKNYRDEENRKFADYMRKEWEAFRAFQGIPIPKSPDPVTPPVKKDPEVEPENHPVPQGKLVPVPEPNKQPLPAEPIPVTPEKENSSVLNFTFFDIPCSVAWNDNLKFNISSLDGNSLAGVWSTLSGKAYNDFLSGCISLRAQLSLCDWAYVEMLRSITANIFGSPSANEAVFLQMYVLSQTGYKVRIAQVDNSKLVLMVNTDYDMYSRMYLDLNGEKYFLVDSEAKEMHVLNGGFKNEQPVSLRIDKEQFAVKEEKTQPKAFASVEYPSVKVKTEVNKKLINFYNLYPHCDWKVYAHTPISETVKNNLYPVLKTAIVGKSKSEAANILINFVQTAFEYKTDEEQFGYERPFFPDEVFYYPYCDCEDRAILFSTLVRDLLNLDVVLLHYPNHLATALRFDEEVKGDYVMVGGKRYLVCDPTYIGAPIGNAMPQLKNVPADVVLL